jgi:hypothetical protein
MVEFLVQVPDLDVDRRGIVDRLGLGSALNN